MSDKSLTTADLAAIRKVFPEEELRLLDVLADAITGRDSNTLINGLMRLTVLSAIISGVAPEMFTGCMKVTWDHYADELNKTYLNEAAPRGQA